MVEQHIPEGIESVTVNENAETVLARRYYRKDVDGNPTEDATALFWRVAFAIAAEEAKYEKTTISPDALAKDFYSMMANMEFLPNSPTLMNAGTPLGQLAACFVLPVGDSIEEIFDAVKYAAMIHKSGGGTGFSFSRLRPKDARVGSTGGVASGPVSFLRIFNTATEQIKQGGTRRGANMGILRVDHPDVMEFIRAKEREGEFNNFNFSVALTEDFMKAVESGEDYELINPSTKQTVDTLNAREVFEILVQKAWEKGDPGIVFLDRINRDNPTPTLGEIESTNPCGEQPLLPYEACNLGSINLKVMVTTSDDEAVCVDWERLRRVVHLSVRFLDNVIDASRYPLDRITEMVTTNRKIGLGIMGWADMLFQMEVPYNSQEALNLAEKVMEFIQAEGRAASKQLAKERGEFPAYKDSVFGERDLGPYRNATVTTIAPTGTLSIIAGCSSGIEPLFALSFARHVMDGDKLVETNPFFKNALEERGCYSEKLMEAITESGSIADIEYLPEDLRKVFVTAMDIEGEYHLKMQAAFQKYTDNAVSKTVNVPKEATVDDIRNIYWMAYEQGCKGVTVYRDGSLQSQVLCTEGSKPEDQEALPAPARLKMDRPEIVYGFTQKVPTGMGVLYVTINEIDGKPFELFTTIGKSGRSITAKAEAIGRLVSLALRAGIEPIDIVRQLKGIGGEHPVFQKKGLLLSIPDAIAWVLENRYLKSAVSVHSSNGLTKQLCPECNNELVFEEGCNKCYSCGFTKCG